MQPATKAVLKCVSCKCRKYAGSSCTCKRNRIFGIGACICHADKCANREVIQEKRNNVDQLLSDGDSDVE